MSVLLAAASLIAAAPGASIQDLVEAPYLSGVALSPDARWVAFRTATGSVATNGYGLCWWVVPADGSGPAHRVGSGGQALYTIPGTLEEQQPIWSPKSDAIYYRAAVEGAVQVWRASRDGRDAQPVTQASGNVRTMSLSADGRQIDYQVGPPRAEILSAEEAASDAGILIDHTVDLAQPLERAAWIDGRLSAQRIAGPWFTRGGILWRQPPSSAHLMIGAASAPPSRLPSALPVTSRVEVVQDEQERPWVRYSAGGREARWSPDGTHGAERVDWATRWDEDRVLIATLDGHDREELQLWTPASGQTRKLRKDVGLLRGSDSQKQPCAIGPGFLICVAASTTGPAELVRIDGRTGARTLLVDPAPGLRIRSQVRTEALSWQWAPGKTITGELLLPSGSRPEHGFPLVINYYACPGYLRGGIGNELPMQPLARTGIAVLCVNAIGGPDAADIPQGYQNGVTALTRIVTQLSDRHLIDPDHIGMSGLSFGSEMTMVMARTTHLLRAASISSVQLEPHYYWLNTLPGSDVAAGLKRFWKLGSPDTDPDGWKRVSPALDTAHIDLPLLMQLPENEARNSVELYARLAQEGKPVELYAFPHEAHNKEEPRHKLAVYQRNLDWFRFWLQGESDPDPSRAAQYERWRALASRWKASG